MDIDPPPPSPSTPPLPPVIPRASAWEWIRGSWPASLATAGLLILMALILRKVKAAEGGRYVYTVDDGYFHMAVAKNLLHHGLWGTSALDGFSSGTSSLVWPLLIALSFACFGIHEYIPLVLNLIAGVGLLFYAGYVVRRVTGSGLLALLVLAAVILFMSIPAVASTGMEHCLQAFLAVVFVDLAARLLTDDAHRLASRATQRWLNAVAVLLVMTRYEGLFLVAPVGLLLLVRRRWIPAVLLGFFTGLPIGIFGLIAKLQGWYFLPNSLLIKGNTQVPKTAADLLEYVTKWYGVMLAEHHMFTLVAAVTLGLILVLQKYRTPWNYPALFLFITLLAALQHLQFAGIGWFYRYEAYLIALGLVGLGLAWGDGAKEFGKRNWLSADAVPRCAALAFLVALFGAPLWSRGVGSLRHIPLASYNIYEQQYQMGHFIRQYYDGKGVAANDVGAISFFGNVHLLDVVGLSDVDVLRARRAATLDSDTIRRLSAKRRVELVVVYDSWGSIYGGPLPEWTRVGQWTIPHNSIVGDSTVSFYAPRAELVPTLKRQLRAFGATLPKDILQDGMYLDIHPLVTKGTYGPEGNPSAAVYWVGSEAQFTVYPGAGVPLDSESTTLKVMVLPAGDSGLSFEAFFNDQPVATSTVPPGSATWHPIITPARWRPGPNVLKLVGHGTPVHPPNDSRPFLFRVLDPRRTMDDGGNVISQAFPIP